MGWWNHTIIKMLLIMLRYQTLGNALDFGDLFLNVKLMVDVVQHHQQEEYLWWSNNVPDLALIY